MTYDTMTDAELNAAVAEKVMGWELVNCDTDEPATTAAHYRHAANNDGWAWLGRSGDDYAYAWSPSTSIADAFEVVDCLVGKGYQFNLNKWDCEDGAWRAEFEKASRCDSCGTNHTSSREFTDPSRTRAICLAALMAVAKETP